LIQKTEKKIKKNREMIENGFNDNLRNISKHRSNLDIGNEIIAIEKNKQDTKIEVSKQSRIRKCFKEMIMHSTIHALPKIIKADKFYFKIMWILFFIISFGFNFQLLIRIVNDYLLYETITAINIGSEQPGFIINIKKF
jgi:hypothetical protein